MSEYGYEGTNAEIDLTNMLNAVVKKDYNGEDPGQDDTKLNTLKTHVDYVNKNGFVENGKIEIKKLNDYIKIDTTHPDKENNISKYFALKGSLETVLSRHKDLMGSQSGGKRKKQSKSRRKNKKSRKSVKSRKSQKKRKSRKRMKTRKKRK